MHPPQPSQHSLVIWRLTGWRSRSWTPLPQYKLWELLASRIFCYMPPLIGFPWSSKQSKLYASISLYQITCIIFLLVPWWYENNPLTDFLIWWPVGTSSILHCHLTSGAFCVLFNGMGTECRTWWELINYVKWIYKLMECKVFGKYWRMSWRATDASKGKD